MIMETQQDKSKDQKNLILSKLFVNFVRFDNLPVVEADITLLDLIICLLLKLI